jgi:myosin heavy subunit
MLIALIAVSLVLAAAVFYALQQEKSKNLALQAELADVKTAQKISESKLDESKKAISGLELKLREAQAKVDNLTSELEQERTARQEASSQAEQLKVELAQREKTRVELENKLTQAQGERKKQQDLLAQLENKKLNLEAQIKDLESQLEQTKTKDVELGTIVVAPEGEASSVIISPATASSAAVSPATSAKPEKTSSSIKASMNSNQVAASSFEGMVLVVNKDYNFVVLNMGSKDGVRIGDVFSIYHSNKYIGDVKVDKVHDSMAAAGFLSVDLKDKVSEGDKVSAKTR